VAENRCIGINKGNGLKFFMKSQLIMALSDVKQFVPSADNAVKLPSLDSSSDEETTDEDISEE
jgi:hypothetical protein